MDCRNIIIIEPAKLRGEPGVRGLRMTVYDALEYLAAGMSVDQLLGDFPTSRRPTSPPASLRRGPGTARAGGRRVTLLSGENLSPRLATVLHE